jgi:hypothetical protein
MKYAAEMCSIAMVYILSFIKIGSAFKSKCGGGGGLKNSMKIEKTKFWKIG